LKGGAAIAVAATATIPQLGFIHEDSGQSFVLDIADLHRDSVTLPAAFRAVKAARAEPTLGIERLVRRTVGAVLSRQGVISTMIDQIKTLLSEDAVEAEALRR
jgi:CRISP-associated protein Cas1